MYVALALLFATQAPLPEAGAAPPSVSSVDALVDQLMSTTTAVARVAVPDVRDDDEARGRSLQLSLVRALLDRGREEVVTPAMVRQVLGDAAHDASPQAYGALTADHVLLAEVVDSGGELSLYARLLRVEDGGLIADGRALLDGAAVRTSAAATTVRKGVDLAVDQLAEALAVLPGNPRYQRVAVAPLEARGEAAQGARMERFAQAELIEGLRRRGYLVVEREQLRSGMEQLSLGQLLGEQSAPELGRLLDAQAMVLGSVSDAGEAFTLELRAVSVEGGEVLGAASALLPREGAVTLASGAVETRSGGEALFRSLVAPGWGQFYNRQPVKGFAFGAASYGTALATLGLGIGGAASAAAYGAYRPEEGKAADIVGNEARALRLQSNTLFTLAAVAGGITAVVWGANVIDAFLDGAAAE